MANVLRIRLLVTLAALTAAVAAPATGATTVYKCFDRSLGVLYTDQPCRGEELDIRAGNPDPVAIAELQREREALSRSAAQRLADYRRIAAAGEGPVVSYITPPDAAPYPYADYYGGAGYSGYGYAPYARGGMRPDARPSRDRDARPRTVPNPPPGLPRR